MWQNGIECANPASWHVPPGAKLRLIKHRYGIPELAFDPSEVRQNLYRHARPTAGSVAFLYALGTVPA